MTDWARRTILIIGMLGAIVILGYAAGVSKTNLIFFGAYTAFSTWRARRKRSESRAFWSIVWEARAADQVRRAQLLEGFESGKLRDAVLLSSGEPSFMHEYATSAVSELFG
jgi:hypothetical protein